MWPLVTYSYYFGIVSTVTKEQGTAEVRMFLFNTVILYYNQGSYNICSTWFLDIVISTCLCGILYSICISQDHIRKCISNKTMNITQNP